MTVLEVRGLGKHYPIKRFLRPTATVKAVDGVSFRLEKGKTLAVVGESGCGKSTLAKLLMMIEEASFGEVWLEGKERTTLQASDYRRKVQMIFQDPYSSLNPRKKAKTIIAEPLAINTDLAHDEQMNRVREMLRKVGLRAEYMERYPHMFSGGQRQRLGIARALMLRPDILICDEPVSALDVSIQAQVLNLLMDLQDEFKLSYIFISHDLSIVRHIADDVLVMYLGKVMEYGPRQAIFAAAKHPYTQALLASTPDLSQVKEVKAAARGELPSPMNPPPGCPFQKRCPHVMAICQKEMPPIKQVEGRDVACYLY